ncbi:MAG TPA: alpha/beta fold hydrolase [Pyrinomonadaceae bacterium]|nr:alpha/beta fold hydrolase [Pyrinomonadaceae bacterium]
MTKTNSGREVNAWVGRLAPNPQARLRLFCFPYAGGSAHAFRAWPEKLSRIGVEVCPVQLPGRGSRMSETPYTRLAPLVEAIAAGLRPLLDKPYAFFGHSMGALTAFELARLLRREGAPALPAHLFLSAASAAHLVEFERPTYDLPEAEFIEELRRLSGTPPEVLEHPELLSLLIPLLRADFAVCQTYEYAPEAPLNCPITAFGGLEDDEVPRARLEAWGEHTTAAFKLRLLPGDHFFMHSSQTLLLDTLAQELARQATPGK